MEKQTIGKFIAALRKANGMTQKELGERLYVSDKTVSRWERDECTPELNLIPAMAEIFGITADELLRGQRRAAGEACDTNHQKEKSDRQFRLLLQRRRVALRNRSLIARGLAVLGLIAAAICDLCWYKSLLGFWLGAVFLLAAVICQLCFDVSARLMEDERPEDAAAFNCAVTRTTVSVLTLTGCAAAFLLPLLLAEAWYGLDFGGWLALGLGAVALVLLVGHLVYTLWLRPALVARGLLGAEDGAQSARDKTLLRKLWKCPAILTAACLAAVFALEVSGGAWLAPAETFDNWADFEDFAYRQAMQEMDDRWGEDSYSVNVLPEGWVIKVDGEVMDSFLAETVTDAEGQVLSTYAAGALSRIDIAFDKSPDGLPVKVWTFRAMTTGFARQDLLQGALGLTIAVGWVVCAAVYLRRRKWDKIVNS